MKKQWKISKMLLALPILAAVLTSASAATESTGLCDEFRRLASAPQLKGFEQYRLWDEPGGRGRYSNIDVDGDDISDVIEQSCPGSKETPSDNCMISIMLSSSGKRFEFSAQEFFLFRYRGQVFIVERTRDTKETTRTSTSIHKVSKNGIVLACHKL